MTHIQRLHKIEEQVRLSDIQLYDISIKLRRIEKILEQKLLAICPSFSEIPDIEIETRLEG